MSILDDQRLYLLFLKMEYFVHGNFRLVTQFGFWHVFTSLIKFYLK